MPLKVESVDLMPVVEDIIESLVAGRKPATQALVDSTVSAAARQAPTLRAPGAAVGGVDGLGVLGALVGGLSLVARPRLSRAERRRLAELERLPRAD